MKRLFFAFLLTAPSGWSLGVEFAKNVVIQSEYVQGNPVKGTGSLVEVPSASGSRFFIITASHVSQGKNLKILINHKPISLASENSRIWDARRDIEIIEVESNLNLSALAKLNKSLGGEDYLEVLLQREEESSFYLKHTETGDRINPFYVGVGSDRHAQTRRDGRSFLVIPPFRYQEPTQNLGLSFNGQFDPLSIIQESLYGETLFTPALGLISEGMSGAPLIQSRQIDNKVVKVIDGVAIQFLRFGSKSYFAQGRDVVRLLNRFMDGRRGPENQYRWSFSHGQMYRDFCVKLNNDCLPARELTDQERAPVGGVRGDGGFTGQEKDRPSIESIGAPLQIKNQPIFAFRVKRKAPGAPAFLIEANLAGVDFIEKNQNQYEIEMIGSAFVARDLFLQRYQNNYEQKIRIPMEFTYRNYPLIKLTVDEEGMAFQFPIGHQASEDKNVPPNDLITFSLDEFGRVRAGHSVASHFRPIIKVRGSRTNKVYYVDLRQLFFIDLSDIPKDLELYASVMNMNQLKQPSSALFLEEVFGRGGLLTLRDSANPSKSAIVQFYQPSKSWFDTLFDTDLTN